MYPEASTFELTTICTCLQVDVFFSSFFFPFCIGPLLIVVLSNQSLWVWVQLMLEHGFCTLGFLRVCPFVIDIKPTHNFSLPCTRMTLILLTVFFYFTRVLYLFFSLPPVSTHLHVSEEVSVCRRVGNILTRVFCQVTCPDFAVTQHYGDFLQKLYLSHWDFWHLPIEV